MAAFQLPSLYLKDHNTRFLVLDPSQDGATVQTHGAQQVTYSQSNIPHTVAKATKVTLTSFTTRLPLYNIVDYSSYFPVGLKNNVVSLDGTPHTITPGNYSALDLAALLQSIAVVAGYASATVQYNPITLKFYFVSGGAAFTWIFPTGTGPWLELGFLAGTSYTGTSFNSPYTVDLSPPNQIFISIPKFSNNSSLVWGTQLYEFYVPNILATPAEGTMTTFSSPKLQTFIPTSSAYISNITMSLWFPRGGVMYPLYSDTSSSSYSAVLAFE